MRYALLAAMLLLIAPAHASCISDPHDIKVFVTEWCPYCRAEIRYLRKRDLEFYECDIEADESCSEELQELTGSQGVPVTYFCSRKLDGFDEEEFDALLGEGTE